MRIAIALILSVLLAACATPQSDQTGSAKAGAEIMAAAQGWCEVYNSRDPQRITAYYAPDAVFWGTSSKTVRANPAQIMEYFKPAPGRPNARVEIMEQHVQAYGDTGIVTGIYNFSDIQDGKRVPRPSRFSMVFNKRGGAWVLVQHHSSQMP
jgi:uncharacterized protein (TIGR02246 family)